MRTRGKFAGAFIVVAALAQGVLAQANEQDVLANRIAILTEAKKRSNPDAIAQALGVQLIPASGSRLPSHLRHERSVFYLPAVGGQWVEWAWVRPDSTVEDVVLVDIVFLRDGTCIPLNLLEAKLGRQGKASRQAVHVQDASGGHVKYIDGPPTISYRPNAREYVGLLFEHGGISTPCLSRLKLEVPHVRP